MSYFNLGSVRRRVRSREEHVTCRRGASCHTWCSSVTMVCPETAARREEEAQREIAIGVFHLLLELMEWLTFWFKGVLALRQHLDAQVQCILFLSAVQPTISQSSSYMPLQPLPTFASAWHKLLRKEYTVCTNHRANFCWNHILCTRSTRGQPSWKHTSKSCSWNAREASLVQQVYGWRSGIF